MYCYKYTLLEIVLFSMHNSHLIKGCTHHTHAIHYTTLVSSFLPDSRCTELNTSYGGILSTLKHPTAIPAGRYVP